MKVSGLARIVHVLRQRNYGLYAGGNLVSLIGTWMQRIGVGWLTWELTGSGAWLGLVAFADLFPAVFIGPFGGAIADRMSRLKIIRVSQALAMLQAFTLFGLTAAGLMRIELLFALTLLNGIVIGFNQPSRLALISSLVRRGDLPTAVAVNAVIFNTARFIGPALAGGLILAGGASLVFLANGLSFLAFLFILSRLRLGEPRVPASGPKGMRGLALAVGDGLSYAARHPGIGPLLLMLTMLSLGVRPFVELLPGFADAVFGRGAAGLAALSAAVGAGAVFSGLWIAQRGPGHGLTQLALRTSLLVMLAVLAFAAMRHLWLAMLCVTVAGAGMTISGVVSQTLIQNSVEEGFRARVLSLYGIIFRGGPAAGALMMGAASETTGLQWPLAAGCLAAVAIWYWTWRRAGRMAASLEARPVRL